MLGYSLIFLSSLFLPPFCITWLSCFWCAEKRTGFDLHKRNDRLKGNVASSDLPDREVDNDEWFGPFEVEDARLDGSLEIVHANGKRFLLRGGVTKMYLKNADTSVREVSTWSKAP
ncbi:hypothetical protein LINGRAHAP2_LOCUS30744 [Linum grandiflorum]